MGHVAKAQQLGLWALRVASIVAFGAYLAWDWSRLPQSSILLGPFWFTYRSHEIESWAIAGVLFFVLISPALKLSTFTVCASVVALTLWLFAGVAAWSAGC
jgi:hypothetical protein